MKLYTKEMFLEAAEKCEVSMIDARHIMQYIDEYSTPIELPSEDEIEMAAEEKSTYRGTMMGFEFGAKWVIDFIKQKEESFAKGSE